MTLTATGVDGLGLADAPVTIERVGAGSWVRAADVVTDAVGVTTFALPVARTPDDNRLRATYAGDATHPAAVSAEHVLTLVPRESRLRLRRPEARGGRADGDAAGGVDHRPRRAGGRARCSCSAGWWPARASG